MAVKCSLGDTDRFVEVVVIKGRIDDGVAVVFQVGRFDAADYAVPTVKEEYLHYFFFVPVNFPDAS